MDLKPGVWVELAPEDWRDPAADCSGNRVLRAEVVALLNHLMTTAAPDSWGGPGRVWWFVEVLPAWGGREFVLLRHAAVAALPEPELESEEIL